MGTGRGYAPSRSYSYQGGNYGIGSSNYGHTNNYESPQRRYSSSYESPQRRYSFSGDAKGGSSVRDRFSFWAALDKSYNSSLDRSYGNKDRYSSLDRYSTRSASSDPYGRNSGYMSDFGGSVKSYASIDRGSLRSGKSYGNISEREGSPYSSRSSRYDYGSSVSPYSTYNKQEKPTMKRSYSYEKPPSVDYSRPISRPASSKSISYSKPREESRDVYRYNQRNARKKRGEITTTDSDDSAPEADKADPTVKYMMCRGTLPMGEDESRRSKRENADKEKKRISRTKRIRIHRKDVRVDRYGKVVPTNLPKPMLVDCAVQTNVDRDSRRERIMAMAAAALTNDKKPKESNFSQYKNRFLDKVPEPDPTPPPRKKREEEKPKKKNPIPEGSTSDALGNEKSWRQSVYGEPEKKNPGRGGSRSRPQSYVEETDTDMSVVDDDRSVRKDRYSRNRGRERETGMSEYSAAEENYPRSHRSRGSGMNRSNSREDRLEDRSSRSDRRRADLTPETLSMKESIDKVQKWKQKLPPPAMDFGTDYSKSQQQRNTGSRSSRQSEREPSPDRGRHRSGASDSRRGKQATRHGSNESIYSTQEEEMIGRDPLLPNKDFRKSNLNKAAEQRERQRKYIEQLQKPFERDQSPNETHARSSRHGKSSKRNSGSSSDAFSRDGSPNARYMPSRQSDQRSVRRDSSREDILDDRGSRQRGSGSRSSRRDGYDEDRTGFSREGSPNRGYRGTNRQSSVDDSRRHDRRSNRYDSDRDYEIREGRPYPGRHNEYYRQQSQDDQRRGRGMKPSTSSQSVASNGSLPDIVPGSDAEANQSGRYSRDRKGNILDAPVPAVGHPPLEPQSSIEEKQRERQQRREALDAMMKKIEEDKKNKPKQQVRSFAFDVFSQKTAKEEEEQRKREEDMEERKKKRAEALAAKQAALEQERQLELQQQRLIEFDSPPSESMGNDSRKLQSARGSQQRLNQQQQQPSQQMSMAGGTQQQQVQQQQQQPQPGQQRRSYQQYQPQGKGAPVADNQGGRKPPTAGQHMRALLRDKRGRVTIRDILTLCEKEHGERPLLPMMNDVDDANFKGYRTITEMLDVMGVDPKKLDDCALQIYKYNNSQGDYGTYLDLESPLNEQAEELEGFQDQRKNALILRTQLSVRVHCVIEKLLNSTGRELRRALFSLKQIFQDDKDLVHEFVNNDGLDCLIKVGAEADQNYQNYILRALGQVMLYVDGMNGVIAHNATIQWLYSLLSSRYRLVIKTALKLLLVFVEYTETNTQLLLHAVNVVDSRRGAKPWTNIMNILEEKDGGDSELLVYTMTLVNKVLNAIPDQDAFYDVTDALEELGMEKVTKRHMRRRGTDLDLIAQFQIFEAALKHEDGQDNVKQVESLRRTPRIRSEEEMGRKSRRYSSGTPPAQQKLQQQPPPAGRQLPTQFEAKPDDDYRDRRNKARDGMHLPPENVESDRLRAQQPRGMPYQDESPPQSQKTSPRNTNQHDQSLMNQRKSRFDKSNSMAEEQFKPNHRNQGSKESGYASTDDLGSTQQRSQQIQRRTNREAHNNAINDSVNEDSENQKWLLYRMSRPSMDEAEEDSRPAAQPPAHMKGKMQKGYSQDMPEPPAAMPAERGNVMDRYGPQGPAEPSLEPQGQSGPSGDRSGMINKAKDTFSGSKAGDTIATKQLRPHGQQNQPNQEQLQEVKKSESDILWEQLQKKLKRPLKIKNMDFSDLHEEDAVDVFAPPPVPMGGGVPPPPPPMMGGVPPPPPPMMGGVPPPPPPMMGGIPPPPPPSAPSAPSALVQSGPPPPGANLKKNKKTLKLHWKPLQNNVPHPATNGDTIWKEVVKMPIKLDVDRLEHLFESKTNEMKAKEIVKQDQNKKEIIILDAKRSNAINIGMTKLPPPRTIKTAILKMDTTIMSKEGIEKILDEMVPTEEERKKILDAQIANPDTPLGTAEQFLVTLSSVSELEARLQLWLFKLDYENMEQEVAEPLMDLKQGIEDLIENKTFKYILTTILAIGNFLNGATSRAFSIEYLSKVPEVKDTVHKHSLLHHLCTIVLEQFPDSSDLYSDIGPITRCAKVDWEELVKKLEKMEGQCKRSWDHLRAIAKHDGSYAVAKTRNAEFLSDAAERIMVLQMVYQRVINRYGKLLLYMGLPVHQAKDTKINYFCKIISEFALEFRTTREKVLQQMLKKEKQRERKKTRGKMIMDAETYKRGVETQSDDPLSKLLTNGYASAEDGSLPGQRSRRKMGSLSGSRSCLTTDSEFDTGDDEILEACVRTATKPMTRAPRERKRARNQRKSLRRTLKSGLDEEEIQAVAAYSDVV